MAQRLLIDLVLSEELCTDRDHARNLILRGNVYVNGHRASKPAASVSTDAVITLEDNRRAVSRAGQKLEFAFDTWHLDVNDRVAADVGAAGGGFTECLLFHGARRVYAIEAGRGLLNWKIREDSRVVVMEDTNILHMSDLPEAVSFLCIDTAWTPLRRSLPCAARFLQTGGEAVALLKPNYELQKPEALVDGVLTDRRLMEKVVEEFLEWAAIVGWQTRQAIESPVKGDKGNVEFLIHLTRTDDHDGE